MKEEKPSTELLIAPQLAVQRYLDELLQDATLHLEDELELSEESVSVEGNTQFEELVESGIKTAEDIKHQEQDDLVSKEIESEGDIFAAFEFAVAALETDTESLDGAEDIPIGDAAIEPPQTDLFVETESQTQSEEVNLVPQVDEDQIDEAIIEPDSHIENKIVAQVEPEAIIKSDKTKPLPWAEARFECLLFHVGGLKMAVPLVELGGIQKSDYEKVTKIFSQPDWFIGVSSVNDLRIRTVDTARWVMPNHYKGELHDSFKFIIQLDRSNWGLACEDVAEAISLEPSDVKWRSDRSKRPWLAGTVIKHMCAILDVQGFIELLDDPINGFKAHLK